MSEENKQEINIGDKTEIHTQEDYATDSNQSHIGPILGVLIIVLVLIFGGLYLWGAEVSDQTADIQPRQIENNEPETVRANADADILNVVSSSDELDAIEADLESTDLDSLNTELDEINRELDATLGN